MKRNFAFIIFFLIGKLISAQDTIVKRNNEIIPAKIIEITPTEIKYKKFSFQDGPTYVESKSDIQYVKYSNGLKEQFTEEKPKAPPQEETTSNNDYYNPGGNFSQPRSLKMEPYGSKYKFQGRKIGEREMQSILLKTQDRQIINYVQGAKDAHLWSFIGFAAIPLGIGSIAFLANSVTASGTLNEGNFAASVLCFGGAIACPIISGVYKHKRKYNNYKAVEIYNQKY
jgi:hypothetical protein